MMAWRKVIGANRSSLSSPFPFGLPRRHFSVQGPWKPKFDLPASFLVTKSNFEAALPAALAHIHDADFVAVDLELSGVLPSPWHRFNLFDTPECHYRKMKNSVDKFAVLQVGICPFHWRQSSGGFIAYPYTFYMSPQNAQKESDDFGSFLWESESLEFLAYHKFDLNMCFYDGISCVSKDEALFPRQPEASQQQSMTNEVSNTIKEELEGKQKELSIKRVGFHGIINALVASKKTIVGYEEELEGKQKELSSQRVGFHDIINALIASKKTIVGHGCVPDLAHLYAKFLAPLPLTIGEFSKKLGESFSSVMDTKYLIKKKREWFGRRTELPVAYKKARANFRIGSGKTVEIARELWNSNDFPMTTRSDIRLYSDAKIELEAGIDAYMSGCCFVHFCDAYNFDDVAIRELSGANVPGERKEIIGMASYVNLLQLGYRSPLVLNIATGECVDACEDDQSGLALVWGFDSRMSDIDLLVAIRTVVGAGIDRKSVRIHRIDDNSVCVKFKSPEISEFFLQKVNACPEFCSLMGGAKALRFAAPYERLCESPFALDKLSDTADSFRLACN